MDRKAVLRSLPIREQKPRLVAPPGLFFLGERPCCSHASSPCASTSVASCSGTATSSASWRRRFIASSILRSASTSSVRPHAAGLRAPPAGLPRPVAARSRRGSVPARRHGRRRDRRRLPQRPPLDVRRTGAPCAVLERRRAREGRARRRHDRRGRAARSRRRASRNDRRAARRRSTPRSSCAKCPRPTSDSCTSTAGSCASSRPACTRSGKSAAIMRRARRPAREGPRGQRAGAATKDKESLRVHLNASYRFHDVQLTVRNVRIPWIFSTRRSSSGCAAPSRSARSARCSSTELARPRRVTRMHDSSRRSASTCARLESMSCAHRVVRRGRPSSNPTPGTEGAL